MIKSIEGSYIIRMQAELPKDLRDGMGGGQMHIRDYAAAATAMEKYLGEDTLSAELTAEFNALPQADKDAMEQSKKFGKFGFIDRSSKPEVRLGLEIVAKETWPGYRIAQYNLAALNNPDQVAAITKRFPAMTPERIAKALTPALEAA